ncbi:hypothetical protein B0T20DRAFT_226214 [Sordaria brevicollis]|uniref:Extracellular membrane protein CFEM domain-containing protein n=1 Tax=Sordaria brevicollis TaxID=83679 RepID=A0AAE0UBQ8_SORBR|nr:hypothetical protein B0T20DRAFT_226214 [Sordaria brevicollis]
MISNRIIRFALLCASSSLLFTTPCRASPTSSPSPVAFRFPSCVESCVNVSGCGTDNPQCMCKFSGKGIFLELALTCMSYYCESELRRADDTLIDIMAAGCRSIRQPISEEKIEMAEAWASKLIKNLPPATTTTIATTTTKVHQPVVPTTLVTTRLPPPPPPVTATTTDVAPLPPASTSKSTTTLIESSSTSAAPSPSEEPESSSTTTTLQPQPSSSSSSTTPAEEAATSAPPSPPRPRPDSSPYGIGPILSSGTKGGQTILPSFLHWASALLCIGLAGTVFA